MKALNSGCGSIGLDLNSGWNWQPRNQGMVSDLANLDVGVVGRLAGDAQSGGLQSVLVFAG